MSFSSAPYLDIFDHFRAGLKEGPALEPVVSISDELVLQNLRTIFPKSLHDPALHYAGMATFNFAVKGTIDGDLLENHGRALQSIRSRLNSPVLAASESTLGAILLAAGIEAHLSFPLQVQLHMDAIRQLVLICQSQGISLSDGIKRAIFWQDLNTSVMTGSRRVFSHTTFAELHWRRDPFTPTAFILPSGFRKVSHLLTYNFIELLQDIHALQRIRDTSNFADNDVLSMAQIDNHQASIQSRLVSPSNLPPFLECCYLAAYLCSAMLRCKLWRMSVVPSHLSLRLLRKLQQVNENLVWNAHPEVLLWLLHIGGAFAPAGPIRSEYSTLLRLNHEIRFDRLYSSWPELLSILRDFIWSDKAFLTPVKAFWAENQ